MHARHRYIRRDGIIYCLVRTLVSPARSCRRYSIRAANCRDRSISWHHCASSPAAPSVPTAVAS